MHFIVSTQTFEKEVVSEHHLRIMKHAGFDAIEVFLTLPHFDWRDENHIRSFAESAKRVGLRVDSIHAPWMPTADIAALNEDDRTKSVADVKKAVDVIAFLGGNVLVLHPGAALQPDENIDAKVQQSKKSIGEIAAYCRSKSVQIALENPPGNELGGEVEVLQSMYRSLNYDNLKACFDTGHAHIARDIGLIKYYNKEKIYIHLHDNKKDYDEHLLPTKGTIDWDEFFLALKDIKFDGIISLELAVFPNPEQYLKECKEWFDGMVWKHGLAGN
jgi:sugar phosphate isomerase/epimerase